MEPAPVTPTGPETPYACGGDERGIFPVKAAPVDASPIPATKPSGCRPITTVNRTARLVTAVETESCTEVAYTECRKRKEPESEGSNGPLFENDADACWPPMSALGDLIDGGSGGGHTPPSKCARVVASSPLTLPVITAAPKEAHATLATTAASWKEVATLLREEFYPAEGQLPSSVTSKPQAWEWGGGERVGGSDCGNISPASDV